MKIPPRDLPAAFYHADNLAHLRRICAYSRFAKNGSRDFKAVRQIPFPALLTGTGFPRLRNQQCFAHKRRHSGTSLSFFPHQDDGHWIFHCNNPQCVLHGVNGDQGEFWYRVVERAGLAPYGWSRPRAVADLLARVEAGAIDVTITEFEDAPHGLRRRPRADGNGEAFTRGDGYYRKLNQLIAKRGRLPIAGSLPLPKPVSLSVREVIMRLFSENRYMMLTTRRGGKHLIKLRDVWLTHSYWVGPANIDTCSFVSQNYCSRCDVDGTSHPAFAGIERRWLVIEADQGTLEQQFWLHQQLDPACVCWSGGRSLHGWYLVEGWSLQECYDLYAQAISLGVTDAQTWLRCTQARLPGGFSWETNNKQEVLVWNL